MKLFYRLYPPELSDKKYVHHMRLKPLVKAKLQHQMQYFCNCNDFIKFETITTRDLMKSSEFHSKDQIYRQIIQLTHPWFTKLDTQIKSPLC